MLEIDLIRHVKVDGRAALYGSTDVSPLTNENSQLMNRLLSQQNTAACYHGVACSPLKRCAVVAKNFSAIAKLPLSIIDDFQEMNFGLYDGKAFDDLPFDIATSDRDVALHWSVLEAFFQSPSSCQLPQGERLASFHYRVIRAWQKFIAQQMTLAKQKNENSDASHSLVGNKRRRLVVIAHGGVIRMIIAHILQLDWRQASWHQNLTINYASLSRISISQFNTNDKNAKQIFQQVNIIGMPTLEGVDNE